MAGRGAPSLGRFVGKGALHANACPGPWASALDRMPSVPLTGTKRARAGLAGTPLPHAEIKTCLRERSARALVAILPRGAASFVLHDPPSVVDARDPADTAERLVEALQTYGHTALDSAYGALGRLVTFVAKTDPSAESITGSHTRDFLKSLESGRHAATTGLTWVRDHCGCDLPVRAPVMRPYKVGRVLRANDKEPFTLRIMLGLEHLAKFHESPFVRGQAAGFFSMAKFIMRKEQASAVTINATVPHVCDGARADVTCASVEADKNPNPESVRPRPAFAILAGIAHGDAVQSALFSMLEGAEAAKCLILDTDSPDGTPAKATAWVLSPLASSRVDKALQSLLQLDPISMPESEAKVYHGHSAKLIRRFFFPPLVPV